MTNVVEARGLSKYYGSFQALSDVNISVPLGRIVGLIGANGAGKTTMLNAILGLTRFQGELKVLGQDPGRDRAKLMENVSFISDVATLPRWMKVSEALDYVAAVHPNFSRDKALEYLGHTEIPLDKKIRALSKGMVTQLHLAVVMAVDAQLLVLDEPTLGLDIIFRKRFYSSLLGDFFDNDRTIIVTTHQVEEIEHILTDAVFIREGRIVMNETMDDIAEKFFEVTVDADAADGMRALNPISETSGFGRIQFVFEGITKDELRKHGEPKQVGLADLFVAKMTGGQL